MIRLQDWNWANRGYDVNLDNGDIQEVASRFDSSTRGYGQLVRFGFPIIGTRRFLWVCAFEGSLILGVDSDRYFAKEGAVTVEWKTLAPFFRRLIIRNGDATILNEVVFGFDSEYPQDDYGFFGSFLADVFKSPDSVQVYAHRWLNPPKLTPE